MIQMKRESDMKKIKRKHLVLGIAIAVIVIVLLCYYGQNLWKYVARENIEKQIEALDDSERSAIIERQLEDMYGDKFHVCRVIYQYITPRFCDEEYDFENNETYSFVAFVNDSKKFITGYTDSYLNVLCTSQPELLYAEQEKTELDECVQEVISDKDYIIEILYDSKMYFNQCTYDEFLDSRENGPKDKVCLHFTSDTTDEDIKQILSLIEGKELPIEVEAYRVEAEEDSELADIVSKYGKEFYNNEFEENDDMEEFLSESINNSERIN